MPRPVRRSTSRSGALLDLVALKAEDLCDLAGAAGRAGRGLTELATVGAGVLEGLDDGVALRLGEGSVVDENLEGFADSFAAFGSGLLGLDGIVLSAGDHRGEEGGAAATPPNVEAAMAVMATERLIGVVVMMGATSWRGWSARGCVSRIPTLGLPGKRIVSHRVLAMRKV